MIHGEVETTQERKDAICNQLITALDQKLLTPHQLRSRGTFEFVMNDPLRASLLRAEGNVSRKFVGIAHPLGGNNSKKPNINWVNYEPVLPGRADSLET